uniref:tRNA-5-taurinomethyluridine 2-sulfurtransferase n=1 Tax=Panagrellus redivivus TaxID=6233 RepID=A0A7E4W4P3_PANRE
MILVLNARQQHYARCMHNRVTKLHLARRQLTDNFLPSLLQMPLKRVVCAISGGIDSAVSALLLKQRGYDVTGLFMVNWDHVEEGESNCPRTRDLADAQKVCNILDIELQSVNFVKEYWNHVFVPFLESYKQGRAVVPDVACNSLIKFGLFYEYARERLGADVVATGHYARTSRGWDGPSDSPVKLLRSVDPVKDQTYFLANVSERALRNTLFPVGGMYKSEVQKIAATNGLGFLNEKRESMGICFVGKRKNFSDFLLEYIDPVQGPIVLDSSSSHQTIGIHSGVHNFTLGKRVAVPIENYQSAAGLFVAKLDYATQTVYVVEGSHHPSLYAEQFQVNQPIWITPPAKNHIQFALQRNHPPLDCVLDGDIVTPVRPVRAAATGQLCVFYDGDVCLGGGEIQRIVSTL